MDVKKQLNLNFHTSRGLGKNACCDALKEKVILGYKRGKKYAIATKDNKREETRSG